MSKKNKLETQNNNLQNEQDNEQNNEQNEEKSDKDINVDENNSENKDELEGNGSVKDENKQNNKQGEKTKKDEIVRIKAKSNTGLPNYFRAGLRFSPIFNEYEVSKEIYENLKKDSHLDIEVE